MKGDVPTQIVELTAQARAEHTLHEIHGHLYPIPLGEYRQYLDDEREIRKQRAVRLAAKLGSAYRAHKAFR